MNKFPLEKFELFCGVKKVRIYILDSQGLELPSISFMTSSAFVTFKEHLIVENATNSSPSISLCFSFSELLSSQANWFWLRRKIFEFRKEQEKRENIKKLSIQLCIFVQTHKKIKEEASRKYLRREKIFCVSGSATTLEPSIL